MRARSPQALERRVAALKGSEFAIGWVDGDMGQGPAFRCRDPDGHIVELYYETEWYQAPPELKPALKNQAQRFPARGVNVRRLDHLNCLAVDIKANRLFFENYLGLRTTEQIVLNDGTEAAMWMTMSNKSYDFAYTRDHYGKKGRFHHVTYALDSREEILRAADIFLENGVHIETGPHKHAIQQTFFLYVWEPGGNRVEVANAGARLILAPDWKPIVWTEEERKKGQAWGLKTIEFVPHPRHAAGCWLAPFPSDGAAASLWPDAHTSYARADLPNFSLAAPAPLAKLADKKQKSSGEKPMRPLFRGLSRLAAISIIALGLCEPDAVAGGRLRKTGTSTSTIPSRRSPPSRA